MPSITQYALGVFLVLHGAVHCWYVVLSQGWVESEEAMGWNGRSWLVSGALEEDLVLDAGSSLYVLVAVGFAAAGVGYVLASAWWPPVLLGSAILSTVVIVTMWDGGVSQLVEKGAVGVVIDLALVAWLVVVR